MACSDPGSLYKVKFCVHNHIYEEILSAELFEDMWVNGLCSQVIHELCQDEAKSVAVSQFKYPVELLSIHPHTEKPNQQTEQMETEVCYELLNDVLILMVCNFLSDCRPGCYVYKINL